MPAARPHSTRLAVAVLPLAAVGAVLVAVQRPVPRGVAPPRPLNHRIDVNRADAATLALLPGVGPSVAEAIVRRRDAAGRFRTAADLEEVPKIGPITRTKVERWIAFGNDTPASPTLK